MPKWRARSDASEIIEWFWAECNRTRLTRFGPEILCQCETEAIIERSSNPARMRSFLLWSIAIDQAARSISTIDHSAFQNHFRFPKVLNHDADGETPWDWVIYSFHGWDRKMDWAEGSRVGLLLLNAMREWLVAGSEGKQHWVKLAESLSGVHSRFLRQDAISSRNLTAVFYSSTHGTNHNVI